MGPLRPSRSCRPSGGERRPRAREARAAICVCVSVRVTVRVCACLRGWGMGEPSARGRRAWSTVRVHTSGKGVVWAGGRCGRGNAAWVGSMGMLGATGSGRRRRARPGAGRSTAGRGPGDAKPIADRRAATRRRSAAQGKRREGLACGPGLGAGGVAESQSADERQRECHFLSSPFSYHEIEDTRPFPDPALLSTAGAG